jgi:hypothetical protein
VERKRETGRKREREEWSGDCREIGERMTAGKSEKVERDKEKEHERERLQGNQRGDRESGGISERVGR